MVILLNNMRFTLGVTVSEGVNPSISMGKF